MTNQPTGFKLIHDIAKDLMSKHIILLEECINVSKAYKELEVKLEDSFNIIDKETYHNIFEPDILTHLWRYYCRIIPKVYDLPYKSRTTTVDLLKDLSTLLLDNNLETKTVGDLDVLVIKNILARVDQYECLKNYLTPDSVVRYEFYSNNILTIHCENCRDSYGLLRELAEINSAKSIILYPFNYIWHPGQYSNYKKAEGFNGLNNLSYELSYQNRLNSLCSENEVESLSNFVCSWQVGESSYYFHKSVFNGASNLFIPLKNTNYVEFTELLEYSILSCIPNLNRYYSLKICLRDEEGVISQDSVSVSLKTYNKNNKSIKPIKTKYSLSLASIVKYLVNVFGGAYSNWGGLDAINLYIDYIECSNIDLAKKVGMYNQKYGPIEDLLKLTTENHE